MKFSYGKKSKDGLEIVACGKLERVATRALVDQGNRISYQLVHPIMARAGAHLCIGGKIINAFLCEPLTQSVGVIHAVIRFPHEFIPVLNIIYFK